MQSGSIAYFAKKTVLIVLNMNPKKISINKSGAGGEKMEFNPIRPP